MSIKHLDIDKDKWYIIDTSNLNKPLIVYKPFKDVGELMFCMRKFFRDKEGDFEPIKGCDLLEAEVLFRKYPVSELVEKYDYPNWRKTKQSKKNFRTIYRRRIRNTRKKLFRHIKNYKMNPILTLIYNKPKKFYREFNRYYKKPERELAYLQLEDWKLEGEEYMVEQIMDLCMHPGEVEVVNCIIKVLMKKYPSDACDYEDWLYFDVAKRVFKKEGKNLVDYYRSYRNKKSEERGGRSIGHPRVMATNALSELLARGFIHQDDFKVDPKLFYIISKDLKLIYPNPFACDLYSIKKLSKATYDVYAAQGYYGVFMYTSVYVSKLQPHEKE